MKKILLIGAIGICLFTSIIAADKSSTSKVVINSVATTATKSNLVATSFWIDSIYSAMNLGNSGLSKEAFSQACKGYEYLVSNNNIHKAGIMTICDFSQCSNKKRLYVLDLNKGKILFNTYVAHGRNSGSDFATNFSNDNNSNESCLGFMITAETYKGDNGYSMRLDGLEKGFNDNVRSRAIVMHGSYYVGNDRALNGTMMGRSFGCPAVPASEVKKIINCIKGGSCFFNFYPNQDYTQNSKILNADFTWPDVHTLQIASLTLPDTLKSTDSIMFN